MATYRFIYIQNEEEEDEPEMRLTIEYYPEAPQINLVDLYA